MEELIKTATLLSTVCIFKKFAISYLLFLNSLQMLVFFRTTDDYIEGTLDASSYILLQNINLKKYSQNTG